MNLILKIYLRLLLQKIMVIILIIENYLMEIYSINQLKSLLEVMLQKKEFHMNKYCKNQKKKEEIEDLKQRKKKKIPPNLILLYQSNQIKMCSTNNYSEMINQHQYMYIKINHMEHGKKLLKNINHSLIIMKYKLILMKMNNQLRKCK